MATLFAAMSGNFYITTITRLLLAALCGGLVGMERGKRRRAAGLRTHILVCLGAALVMLTNEQLALQYQLADPSRMGAQVISGIGFLGVGTIIIDRQHQVRGLTTAAGLWTCACMGIAIGMGFYFGAIFTCLLVLATITILNRVEYQIVSHARIMEIYVEFENHSFLNPFLLSVKEGDMTASNVEIVSPRLRDTHAAAVLNLHLPKWNDHQIIIERLRNSPGLIHVEEVK